MLDLLQSLHEALGGPGRLRFVIQPTVAILLGIRDGRLDAAAGRRPYVLAVFFVREGRRDLLVSGLKTLTKPLIVGFVVSLIVQYFIFHSVRFWRAVLFGTTIIALPYIVARALTNRIITWRRRRRGG